MNSKIYLIVSTWRSPWRERGKWGEWLRQWWRGCRCQFCHHLGHLGQPSCRRCTARCDRDNLFVCRPSLFYISWILALSFGSRSDSQFRRSSPSQLHYHRRSLFYRRIHQYRMSSADQPGNLQRQPFRKPCRSPRKYQIFIFIINF